MKHELINNSFDRLEDVINKLEHYVSTLLNGSIPSKEEGENKRSEMSLFDFLEVSPARVSGFIERIIQIEGGLKKLTMDDEPKIKQN